MALRGQTTRIWDADTDHTVSEVYTWFDGLFYEWRTDDGLRGFTFRSAVASNMVFGYSYLKDAKEKWEAERGQEN